MAEILIHNAKLIKNAEVPEVSISPLGGDPLNQVFEEETATYLPDRTILPLTLVPLVTVKGVDRSDRITNQGWYLINADGTEQQITSSTAGYSLVSPASGALRLQIRVNTPHGSAGKFVYRCTLGKLTGFSEILVRTSVTSRPGPTLELDTSSSVAWNPFEPSSRDILTITPTIRAHGHTGLSVGWKKIDNGTARAIDPADPKDIECEFDGDSIKVDRRVMGNRISLVAELIKGGTVCDRKYVTITRRIPEMECEVLGSTIYSEDDKTLGRKLQVRLKPGGIVTDPSQELKIEWYEGSAIVGYGNQHSFDVNNKEEIQTKVSVTDRGCLKLATTSDGKYLTYNGKYLLIR